MFRTPTFNLLLGLGLCSAGIAMLYVYFKNKDDEEDLEIDSNTSNGGLTSRQKDISLQLVVSNEVVPVVVGRSGANLKIIEEKTGTVIRFREKDDNNQYCEIVGLPKFVQQAKTMLLKEIQRTPTVKEEIFVPQSACGKIIGRCGESLQEICRKSLAKVSVDSGDRSSGSSTRRVVITGNRTQVNIAKKLIEEKVQEDEKCRKSLEENEQKREPRRSPTNSVSSNHSSIVSISGQLPPTGEKFNVNDAEKPMEVYVSAIASPAKFWLQLVGPQSQQLDDLVENMTDYYSIKSNQALHKIADPYLGQIVAALFKYDGKWYRAEIIGILPNEYNPRDVVLDLYFVDYGDSEYISPNEVFELRTDFLTLRFQAIECYLANVRPAVASEPDMWDPQSIARFEELTHVASWKKLISRVVTYKERPKGGNHIRREGSPVPGVELYDIAEGAEMSIAQILRSQGYAISDYQEAEPSEVLRLGGGNSTSNSPVLIRYEKDENENDDPQQNHVTHRRKEKIEEYLINNGSNYKNYINSKRNTEQLLQTERLNGNMVQENIIKQNRLVQS